MPRYLIKKTLYIALIPIVVFTICGMVFFPGSLAPEAAPSLQEEFDPACPLKMKGLTYISYEKERRVMEMRIGELKIKPRKFMIFNIAGVNELTLTDAHLKLYTTTDSKNASPFEVIEKLSVPINSKKNNHMNLAAVPRGVAKNFSLEIYTGKLRRLTVEAVAAEIDFKRKKIQMKNARVEHIPSGKSVYSSQVLWDIMKTCFKVPGKFVVQTPAGAVYGRKGEFDYDCVIKKQAGQGAEQEGNIP